MNLKQVDDVLGGDEMWKHADQTQGAFRSRSFLPGGMLIVCAPCSELPQVQL